MQHIAFTFQFNSRELKIKILTPMQENKEVISIDYEVVGFASGPATIDMLSRTIIFPSSLDISHLEDAYRIKVLKKLKIPKTSYIQLLTFLE